MCMYIVRNSSGGRSESERIAARASLRFSAGSASQSGGHVSLLSSLEPLAPMADAADPTEK